MEDRVRPNCEGYGNRLSNQENSLTSDIRNSLKLPSMEERNDSGLGSLGYHSAEFNSISSLQLQDEDEEHGVNPDSVDLKQNPNSVLPTDLAHSLSRLNIGSGKDEIVERCDSGLEEDSVLQIRPCISQFADLHWVSPHLTANHIVEIFRGDEDGDNHLHLSIIHNHPELTMQIIGLAPSSEWLNQTNNLQQTPLHLAVLTRQATIVRRLVCAGATVDARDQIGNTPLHSACGLGFEDIVRELLTSVRAEETYQNKYKIPYQRIPQDLDLKNYEGLTCFHLSAFGGHSNIMRQLLTSGANINAAEGKSGRTVLHFAADWGNLRMADFLLSYRDTDINAKTYSGLSPILLAYGRQHMDLAEFLYSKGALVEPLGEDCDADVSDEDMTNDALGLVLQRQPQMVH